MLGRVLVTWSGIQLLLAARGLRRASWLVVLPVALVIAALSALGAWVGYTLATTNWDAPADYPSAEDDAVRAPRRRD